MADDETLNNPTADNSTILTSQPKIEEKSADLPKEEIKLSPLQEARKFNEETKKMLDEMKEERLKIESAAADMLVNGRSLAGQTQKKETEDEKWAREAKLRYAGTGLDPT